MDTKQIRHANLLLLLASTEVSAEAFAHACGSSASSISQVKTKTRNIGDNLARRIEKAMNKPYGWMDTPQEAPRSFSGVMSDSESDYLVSSDLSGAQFADVVYCDGRTTGVYPIPKSDLNELCMTPENSLVYKINGDSMYPYFHSGDLVLINTAITKPFSNKVFALKVDDERLIKRFSKDLDGTWVISADNADKTIYRDFKATRTTINDIDIIGQVVSLVKRSLV